MTNSTNCLREAARIFRESQISDEKSKKENLYPVFQLLAFPWGIFMVQNF